MVDSFKLAGLGLMLLSAFFVGFIAGAILMDVVLKAWVG